MAGFNHRFDPDFLKMHQTLRAGRIGILHLVRITGRDPSPPQEEDIPASEGLFLDMTVHHFDLARFLAGSDIVEVYTRGSMLVDPPLWKAGDWDTAVVMLGFENGAIGTIDNSPKTAYGYDLRVEVFGSEGLITVNSNMPGSHVLVDRTGVHSSPPLASATDRYTESYLGGMSAFVGAVRGEIPAASKSIREHRPVELSEICDLCKPAHAAV